MSYMRAWAKCIKQIVFVFDRVRTNAPTTLKSDREQVFDLSTEEGQRFLLGRRRVYRTEELPHELVSAIAAAKPNPGAFAFDHEVNGKAGAHSL